MILGGEMLKSFWSARTTKLFRGSLCCKWLYLISSLISSTLLSSTSSRLLPTLQPFDNYLEDWAELAESLFWREPSSLIDSSRFDFGLFCCWGAYTASAAAAFLIYSLCFFYKNSSAASSTASTRPRLSLFFCSSASLDWLMTMPSRMAFSASSRRYRTPFM